MPLAYFGGASDDELRKLAQRTIAAAAGVSVQPATVDTRIIRAIAEIRARIDEPILLAPLARRVGLSPGRFRHLFVAETGVSLRAFVLWERLNRALSIGFAGGSLDRGGPRRQLLRLGAPLPHLPTHVRSGADLGPGGGPGASAVGLRAAT